MVFANKMPAGIAPLFLTVSEPQLHTISAVGAGLLVGTALGIILPEGSEAFRAAQEENGTLLRILLRHDATLTKHRGPAQVGDCNQSPMLSTAGGERRLPDSLFGAVLIGGFIVMLLLDQLHTAVAKGKSFQTSPPPTDNDPEDPWKVQVARDGPPKKHVWVSTTQKSLLVAPRS